MSGREYVQCSSRRRENGKGTLAEGREHGQVCNGNVERYQGGGRRRKCGRGSKVADKETYWGKSQLGKRERGKGVITKGWETGRVCDGDDIKNIPFCVKIQKNVFCSKYLWKCDRFHGGLSIGMKAVDFQDTMRQAMGMD